MGYSHIHNLFNSFFLGTRMLQYWADVALWELFLYRRPELRTIIEIGTNEGGLSLFFLGHAIQKKMNFWTFDIQQFGRVTSPLAKVMSLPDHFVLGDVFGDAQEFLTSLLSDDNLRPTLLYCDGGNKVREIQTFVPFLKTGDYAVVHDYTIEFPRDAIDPVAGLVEDIFVEECKRISPCLTHFWRIR